MSDGTLASTLLVALAGIAGCSNVPSGADAGVDAAGDVLGTDAPKPPDGGCTPAPRPSYVPAGWIPYDDYAPCSGLYVPTDASQLPAPITWQDCEPAAGVSGCRRIKFDWSPLPPGEQVTDADAAIDANGHVIVLTSRQYGNASNQWDHGLNLVADADGPVYSAILSTDPNRYWTLGFLPPSFSPPRWILRVKEAQSFFGGGYVGGTLSAPAPTFHFRYGDSLDHDGYIGDLGVIDVTNAGSFIIRDLSSGGLLFNVKSPSLPMFNEWEFGNVVFWFGNTGRLADVGRWDQDTGAVDFIDYSDPNHAAGDLGTDGKDMVWLEGHGNANDAGAFWSTADYWTSPYVTISSQLQPRRLCSESPNAVGGDRVVVGCGYAAEDPGTGLRVVRIADGWSWFLPNGVGWSWEQPLAITCNEVFMHIVAGTSNASAISTMARVALSQLGPGIAAN